MQMDEWKNGSVQSDVFFFETDSSKAHFLSISRINCAKVRGYSASLQQISVH